MYSIPTGITLVTQPSLNVVVCDRGREVMNNNYIRWIKTLSLFFLFVNPLTAAAACQSGGSAKVISKVHTVTLEFAGSNLGMNDSNYIQKCAMWDSKAKKGPLMNAASLNVHGKTRINLSLIHI